MIKHFSLNMKKTLFLALISTKHEQWQTLVFSYYSCNTFAYVLVNTLHRISCRAWKRPPFPCTFSKESHQPAFPCSSFPSPASGGSSQTAAPANEKFNSTHIKLWWMKQKAQLSFNVIGCPLYTVKLNQDSTWIGGPKSSTKIEPELVAPKA